jgi:lactoylglutathione lyase
MTKFLHTMIRVTDPEATIAFFNLLGVQETRRFSSEQGRFTLIYLAAPGQDYEVELTYNWPDPDGRAETYAGGRFGHLAFQVDDIYATCQTLLDAGITINRPRATGTWRL